MDLEAAISFAAALGDSKALMLVVTDGPPAHPLESDSIQWWGFGIPQPNVAFVNATRTSAESGERCLFEITNLTGGVRKTEFVVELHDTVIGESSARLHHSTPDIRPMETHRVVLSLPPRTPALRAQIGDDSLSIDNTVVLLPQLRKPVHVDVQIQDQRLQSLIVDALKATERSVSKTTQPDLIFLDQATVANDANEAWLMRLVIEPEASAYLGPLRR